MRWIKRGAALLAVAAAAAVAAGSASAITAGSVADQSTLNNPDNGYSCISSFATLSQTFTAGLSGPLTDIALKMTPISTTAPNMVVTLSSYPGGATLATTTVPAASAAFVTTIVDANFGTPATVTAGTQYTITLSQGSGTQWGCWDNSSDGTDHYPGGQFNGSTTSDALFATYEPGPPSSAAPRAGYCAAAGDTWMNGTPILAGTFLDLAVGQPAADAHYAGATPAIFVQGRGITCDPPPVGYVRDGFDGFYTHWAPVG